MSNNKLDKLLHEYHNIIVDKCSGNTKRKARQSIIEYVEQEKREAYDKGYEKAVAL